MNARIKITLPRYDYKMTFEDGREATFHSEDLITEARFRRAMQKCGITLPPIEEEWGNVVEMLLKVCEAV